MQRKLSVTILLYACSLTFSFAGCGSTGTAAIGGALAGGAAANTIAGMQADLESARQTKLIELQTAVDQLDSATTETEKAVLQAKVQALESTIRNLQKGQAGVQIVKQGTETDWTDPAAVGGYGGLVLTSLLAWYMRKKGLKAETKYRAHKQGTEGFMKAHPAVSAELYDAIGEARARNNVTP